jgi:hypothetical protein
MQPLSRSAGILFEELDDELVVYDQENDQAHRLNGTAARVWKLCDGSRGVPELAAELAGEGGTPDEGVVRLALDQLAGARLLAEPASPGPDAITRREAMQRMAKVAGVGFILPVVTTISAPTPADAQSHGGPPPWAGPKWRKKGGPPPKGSRRIPPGLAKKGNGPKH